MKSLELSLFVPSLISLVVMFTFSMSFARFKKSLSVLSMKERIYSFLISLAIPGPGRSCTKVVDVLQLYDRHWHKQRKQEFHGGYKTNLQHSKDVYHIKFRGLLSFFYFSSRFHLWISKWFLCLFCTMDTRWLKTTVAGSVAQCIEDIIHLHKED